jgi:UDP-galactopyranose mutase
MKKKEKFYPVNNQEDEDGYSLYQADARKKQSLSFPDNFENTRHGYAKLQTRRLILSSFQQSLKR